MADTVSEPVTPKTNPDRFAWRIPAKALYLKRVPTKVIAHELGVSDANLRKWIERSGLSKIRDEVKEQVIAQTITVTRTASNAPTIAPKDSLRPMLHELHRTLLGSPALKRKPRTIREVEQLARVLNTVTGSAKTIEGWGDRTESTISFHLIQDGLSELPDPSSLPPAIEVQGEPVNTPDQPVPPAN